MIKYMLFFYLFTLLNIYIYNKMNSDGGITLYLGISQWEAIKFG